MTELTWLTLPELGRLLRTRKVSAVELAEHFLDRLERLGPVYNAVVTVLREPAISEARARDGELASGKDRGPLHGIPYGAKDLLGAEGAPTTWGAQPYRDQMLKGDAAVIRRLREAGAVLCAKLAMVELAGGRGYNQAFASFTGPGRSPWNPARWSGGSSSGSGSAVGAGLVPFAIGSETWGSIQYPAAFCGVSGLRPTYGRVSRHGAMALSWSMDKLGPLARTVEDCGTVLAAIAGPDPADPSALDRPFAHPDNAGSRRRYRLGVLKGTLDKTQSEVRRNFEESLRVLRGFAEVREDLELPDYPYEAMASIVIDAEAASAFEPLFESGRITQLTAPEDRIGGYAGQVVLAKDYIRALRLRTFVAREADRVVSGLDALVAPGRPAIASPLDREFRSAARGNVADVMGAIGNAAGLPSIAVPNGFSEAGLPTSLQFMGRAWEENTILAAARAWQAITDHHAQHPPEVS